MKAKIWCGLGRGLSLTALPVLFSLGATPAAAQSLADAMVAAYLNSPEISAARSDVKVFAERAVQARADGLPQVDAQGNVDLLAESDDGQDLRFPASAQLNLSQALYTGGQITNQTEAAETRIDARQLVLTATEQQVLLDTVTAYADVQSNAELVTISQNNVRVLNEQLRAANERFQVGEVTRTDVEQARSRLAAAHSRLAANEGALATAREAYRRVVGEYPGELQKLPPVPTLPSSKEEAMAMALRDDPGVIASRLERDAAGSDVRAAIGALLPQLSLRSALQVEDNDDSSLNFGVTDATKSANVGLVLTVPIYTGGRNSSNVREAQAFAEAASSDIVASERNAIRNVGISWANFEVAQASIRAGQLEVSAAQLAFDGVREEAKVGARTTLDVLDAEQEVLDARSGLVTARRDEYVAAYGVLASVGKLTIDHLGLDTGIEDTTPSYYQTVRDRNFGYDQTDDTVWRHALRP